ncbi:MAG: polysaccharide deacetylase family protein [Planctomycetota bacterium]
MPAETGLFVALTVDVDPDANRAVPGRPDAVTAGTRPEEARVDACLEGLAILADALQQTGLPATLFWEGRTLEELAVRDAGLLEHLCSFSVEHGCHSYQHEDFAGRETGLPLDVDATRTIMQRAGRTFRSVFGRAPRGFRAPYCRLTPALRQVLAELGYRYDASNTRSVSEEWCGRPYRLEEGGWELALGRSQDTDGRSISSYLWQMFEGNRPVDDYVQLARSFGEVCPGGLLSLAMHPWHLVVSAANEPLGEAGVDARGTLTSLLQELSAAEGLAFTTLQDYLSRHQE